MRNKELYSVDEIKNMSYTDFVGFVNQWNVPPGAFVTLNKWRVFGNITKESKLLEIACTTGFSSRELALNTGCSATGIDISKKSVEAAENNHKLYAPEANLKYLVADGHTYSNGEKYTHALVGAALRFFSDPQKALDHITNDLLEDDGLLLSCEFYVEKKIPKTLVEKAKKIFNMTVTQQDYKEVMKVYKGLTLLYEDRNTIEMETDEELEHYTVSSIQKFDKENPGYSKEALKVMHDRLLEIKQMSNELRPYQRYNVLVHKKDSRIYPGRYTELF